MEEKTKAFEKGYATRIECQWEKATCPYEEDTSVYDQWWAGVHQAEMDLSSEVIPNALDELPVTEESPFGPEEVEEPEEPNPELILNDVRDGRVTVAKWRDQAAKVAILLAQAEKVLHATQEYQNWQDAKDLLADTKQSTKQAEVVLREDTVAYFDLTGNKKPFKEAYVKEYTVLEYDQVEALAYAKKHLTAAVVPESLNVKAFEKVAAVVDLAFVTKVKQPKGTIASKLGHLLEG